MTRRPRLLTTAAAGATAALLLTACGGGTNDTKSNDKIDGAETAPATTATSTTPTRPSADRPRIELPSDLSYAFDWSKTGDADKDAVLSDSEQSIKAVDLAIVNQNALDKAYLYYYEGEAAVGTQKFIQTYVDNKASVTGAYRFYDPQVSVDKGGTASLSYCEDQGKAYVKYLKTNEVKRTQVTAKSYVSYHTSLKKNGKGVWVIQKIVSQSGSAQCQP
ncbi:hypothetical protein [Streptomyces sp. BK239]|uniref:hypothetical protein n=1 Tax=Streptomyces sp. BK239 TaxID=2512155 RepID=UPI00102AC1E6|nr:hypothetical protein [Streptomyces sp. BK239]RZU16939.1 hypothetical protein EV567_3371 [Streptomyces sp. BK239]